MTGGFSRFVSILETAKGWTTEYILNMPLCRARQAVELVIQERREQAKYQAQLTEWSTKNIAMMFATQAESDKQARQISKMVEKMKLPLADEEADVIDERTPEEILEQGAKVDLSNQPSFEALEAAFHQM